MHLFKRQANKRGIFLLSLFCIYALISMVPVTQALYSRNGNNWWWTGQGILFLMLLMSLITPVISLFKPGFSYKGHPGMRHATLAIAGGSILMISFVIICASFSSKNLKSYHISLYSIVFPLHGLHCLAVYSSYFKGPTSKFGKIYQPYLPIIE